VTLTQLLPLFAQTGLTGALAWLFYRLHRSAMEAERRRADDWRLAAKEWKALALARDAQFTHVLSAVETTATADPVKDGA
jgi:hypothetical protein